jgi:chromosome segregation protein
MTALLTRLRIAGFKSFAEPATLDILPGLTGIVGPNGCGKSNVVEALRWAMGETSVRSLRGGEMDDVIFAGTGARSSRNLAEVTITLNRGDTALPDPFGAEDELAVTRRIERGAGSAYRANGREMRARDVQTLFADMASGAHSSAMVSQGRVAALVNAKPEARRQVLEEAAGITGLHARRHEAELKLRAAEANLAKAEDLRTQLDTTREGLRKQARQASRFRNISGHVRAAETEFLAVQHGRALAALNASEAAQAAARAEADAAEAACIAAEAAVASAEAGLPAPRAAEGLARSALERRRLEAETLSEEAARAARAYEEAASRLAHIDADLADACRLDADASEAVAALRDEAAALAAQMEGLPDALARGAAEAETARAALAAAEQAADGAATAAAEAAAAARQATLTVDAAAARLEAAEAALAAARQARDLAEHGLVHPDTLAEANAAVEAAEATLGAARTAAAEAESGRAAAAEAAAQAQAALERAASQAREAETRLADATARDARLTAALAGVEAELAQATARLVPTDRLQAARTAAETANAQATDAEATAQRAEQEHLAAGAARLECARARDALRASHARAQDAAAAAQARLARLKQEALELDAAVAKARDSLVPEHLLEDSAAAEASAAQRAEAAGAALQAATIARAAAESALAEARRAAAAAAANAARCRAEAEGLRQVLAGQDDGDGALLDVLTVPPGLEAAIGAALSQAASSLDDADPQYWRLLPPLQAPALPGGARPLAELIAAPPALTRALSHIGLIAGDADGAALQPELAPGCALVSAAGDAWRWDGQVRRGGAPNAAAARLRQRARLRDTEAALIQAQSEAEALEHRESDAAAALADAAAADTAARSAHADATACLAEARQALTALRAAAARAAEGVQALHPALARLATDRDTAEATALAAAADLASLPALDLAARDAAAAEARAAACAQALEAARNRRDAARAAAQSASAALRQIEAEAGEADSRVAALRPQLTRLQGELTDAREALNFALADTASLAPLPPLRDHAEAAARKLAEATQTLAAARAAEEQGGIAQREAVARAARLDRAQTEASSLLAGRETMLATAREAFAREQAALDLACEEAASLPDPAELAEAATVARAALTECRDVHAKATSAYAETLQIQASAQQRTPILAQEQAAWATRAEEATRRRVSLAERHDAALAEVATLQEAPSVLRDRADSSGAALAEAEAAHAAAAAALQAAESALRSAGLAQRDADARVAACREALARGEGAVETAAAALSGVLERVVEKLGADAVLPEAEALDEAAEEKARRKLDRLQRERDEMGPVNLRADLELDELTAQIEAIERDRDELTTAIAKLRGSIGHLNREGRERLSAVFTEVDRHFRTLFTRMMGGGRAHLALTGSDDPLEAGLEIYAEPPGKKLSTLSLLSGGEQALTALSLIFAVFRCTPAPIAVLDEVDAPLDDANVDRFCTLLEDVVRDTGTRFLVVTHHQLTMSRMDRLYGVTMAERGVSRVLSVDLRRAAEMVEPALQAAE